MALQFGGSAEAAAWLFEDEETLAASDAARVHAADLHEWYVGRVRVGATPREEVKQ